MLKSRLYRIALLVSLAISGVSVSLVQAQTPPKNSPSKQMGCAGAVRWLLRSGCAGVL